MFRLGHLSDPHFQNFRIDGIRELFGKRALGGLNLLLSRRRKHRMGLLAAMQGDLQRRALDHLAITGDFCNIALTSEWEAALRWIAACGLGPESVTVIPGNHDAYVPEVVKAGTFDRLFAPYMTAQARIGDAPYPFARVRGEVAFVCLSTAVPTGDLGAWGEIGAAQMDRLRAMLLLPELRDRFRVVLIHHPPLVHRPGDDRNLRDMAALQALFQETGADLVLHGHDHRDYFAELPGPGGKAIPVIGVGSASYNGSPGKRSRYHVFEIEGRAISVVTYAHVAATNDFQEAYRRTL